MIVKIFYSSVKLIASDSDIDEAFKSLHLSITAKIKNSVCKDWIALDVIMKRSIKVYDCYYKYKKRTK